ncbi:uncharacterized protein LOC129240123 [Anastrepha obliqua]|uniref:uncharacterized protein LOC129240123 n=1 Tax=Anastrepha obliqua TaxID=95512 RepID=UPI0024099BEA|nr:uncharacterized protein LOC129240123 [Anastrepha obliqua]
MQFVIEYSLIAEAVPTTQPTPLGIGRQLNSPESGNGNITEIFEHLHTNWPINDSVVILWTAAEVDWKYLPTNVFEDINHQLKYYYVLLQRKGYSLYKVVKKALLPSKPIKTGYNVIFKPISNFSINVGFTFNLGASGNLNFF